MEFYTYSKSLSLGRLKHCSRLVHQSWTRILRGSSLLSVYHSFRTLSATKCRSVSTNFHCFLLLENRLVRETGSELLDYQWSFVYLPNSTFHTRAHTQKERLILWNERNSRSGDNCRGVTADWSLHTRNLWLKLDAGFDLPPPGIGCFRKVSFVDIVRNTQSHKYASASSPEMYWLNIDFPVENVETSDDLEQLNVRLVTNLAKTPLERS